MASTERRTWLPSPDQYGPRADRSAFVYEAFVPDSIETLNLELSDEVTQSIIEAERAIGDLQLDTTFAGLEALSRQLLRAESVASSRIEGLRLSQRRVAEALLAPAEADATAREVVGNIEAMQAAVSLGADLKAITKDDILAIHQTLLRRARNAHIGGRLRTEQNWIGGSNYSPRGAEFIPPAEARVPGLLDDLSRYLARVDVSGIVQAAVAHAQFETVHPFADGNGRVGRALIHVILRRRSLSTRFVPPISIVLAANGGRYVEGLTAFRRGEVAAWCQFFALVVVDACRKSAELAVGLAALQDEWLDMANHPRSDSAAARLITELPGHPILDAKVAMEATGVSDVAARNALNNLEQAGVLRPVVFGRRRNRAWEAPALIALLDNFEWSMAEPTRPGEPRRPAPARRGV